MKGFNGAVAIILAFAAGVALGVAIVQLRLAPAWRLIAGTEMRLLHTDFTPNWTLDHKQALYRNNPSPKPIVMVGDSLVDYADWSELLNRSDVGNRGITGDTTEGLLQRVDMVAQPGSIVVVMIGENDLAAHQPLADVCSNVKSLVDRLGANHSIVLQATLLTVSQELNGKIQLLDDCERRTCASKTQCTFLDLNPQIASSGSLGTALTFDGFHLNQAGYTLWAAALRPILEKLQR